MSKSNKEKERLLSILKINEDYSNMTEDHLKIRYRYYGSIPKKSLSHFYQNSMISEKMKELMSDSFKQNIPRLLLPIAKQLGEFEFQINIKCNLQKKFENKNKKEFAINLSLYLLSSDKKRFRKTFRVYKQKRTVYLGTLSFCNEEKVTKYKYFLKGNFNKIEELCNERSTLLNNETNMWLVPNINFHNSEKFALSHINNNTDFCKIRDSLRDKFRILNDNFDFDVENDLDAQITYYYKIGEVCYWTFILDKNLSINTLLKNFGKEKKELDILYKRKEDLSILNITKIMDYYGFLEKESDVEITEDNLEDIITYTRMVKY